MNEVSMFYKQKFCSGVEATNFDDMIWTEANPDFVPEDEGGRSMEISLLLTKKPVIAEKHGTARNNMVHLFLKHMELELAGGNSI